jgi:hypothetical protein
VGENAQTLKKYALLTEGTTGDKGIWSFVVLKAFIV